ncbi:MAG: transglycosylase SLT domain-containing protein [Xanthomonadales bacterium]|nr:transglycosylase SLT domain-containing protein [Xanthomonadales bacterium]
MSRTIPTFVLGFLVLLAADEALSAPAPSLADRRDAFRQALEQAERGKLAAPPRSLVDHPLAAYLELARLRHKPEALTAKQVSTFVARHADSPVSDLLQRVWWDELARRQDWPGWLAADVPLDDDERRCVQARALYGTGKREAATPLATQLWLRGDSAPSACDAVFAEMARTGGLNPSLRQQRIALAAEAGRPSLMRYLARPLDKAAQSRSERFAAFIEKPDERAANWPADADNARIVMAGLRRLARSDPARAEALLDRLAKPARLDADQRGSVLAAVALWSAASYDAESARRFKRVPAAAFDPQLHEWRVREALARDAFAEARDAIARMPAELAAEPRWRYVAARMDRALGQPVAAAAAFDALADEAHYHGFLAADQLQQPYALCPREPLDDMAMRDGVAAREGFVRALELHALTQHRYALLEWNRLRASLDPDRRRIATALAIKAGWTDRSVFDLNSGDDLQFYSLRFPLAHKRHLTQEAEDRGLDPAWIAALIRAESAWQPTVRSHANAYGLMQLLPATGQAKARQLGISWRGSRTLFDARKNITLGTAYLADMLDQRGGQPYLATAAYNAGPAPVSRWQRQRPAKDADLWIETIPYRETREYVARVMAFSAIYDWRLGRDAYPISARLIGQPDTQRPRRVFQCPSDLQQAASP